MCIWEEKAVWEISQNDNCIGWTSLNTVMVIYIMIVHVSEICFFLHPVDDDGVSFSTIDSSVFEFRGFICSFLSLLLLDYVYCPAYQL